ncbi:nuclear transport factor 2 family protein [Microcoleus sp. FACHB-1515]|uniref:nuclear transport factor 2 family protein n=1 Tax=Cyanophyceae TaxID=3028117 RepID=UPI00168861D8|nr:nuclear transport factor 2 family protein [Microcoleus sp. FACHB-1515]MBD2091363.1 nuclear transport factor 2 family protein [Microcoleus sp. FACHB-1515]
MDVSLSVWRSIRLMPLRSMAVGLMLIGAIGESAKAATPDTAPPELTNLLSQIDAAANQRDVEAVLEFYSPNLTHSDGLTRDSLEAALSNLWQRFPDATYETQLTSWEAIDNGYVIETRTTMTGTETTDDREFALNATIDSRQRIEGQAIVEQTILAEQSRLTSGDNPPTIEVSLPGTIRPNTQFTFDAVVQEPLGDRLLLGTALEEPVSVEAYTTTPPIDFELLNSGGLFKVGTIPEAGDRWISAIVVRDDGITVATQRLQVQESDR